MENNRFPKKELIILAVGEAICALLTILVFLAVDLTNVIDYTFSWSVVTGSILGAAVIILNFLFLSFAVNKAVDDYIALRGDKEMTDEEAEAFAAKNSGMIQNAVKKSFIIRTVSIAITLLVAFLTKWFNPLATVIPIISYQPILTWGSYITDASKRVVALIKKQKTAVADEAVIQTEETVDQNDALESFEEDHDDEAQEESDTDESLEESDVNEHSEELNIEEVFEKSNIDEAFEESLEKASVEETQLDENSEKTYLEEPSAEALTCEENTEGV